jgi:hypothetical protein
MVEDEISEERHDGRARLYEQRLLCQDSYFCTSKESKLSTYATLGLKSRGPPPGFCRRSRSPPTTPFLWNPVRCKILRIYYGSTKDL